LSRRAPEFPDILRSPKFSVAENRPPYVIDVITPLFGGGVVAGENDPVTLIRVPAIRGHLRFWWRATRGASCKDVGDLAAREEAIWGSVRHPSPVTLTVTITAAGTEESSEKLLKEGKLGYALFPFQEDRRKSKPFAKFRRGVSFELSLRHPKALQRDAESGRPAVADMHKEVTSALWAWVNFGGIGARTRRGCGALFCGDLAPSSAGDIGSWFQKHGEEYELRAETNASWPILAYLPRTLDVVEKPQQAWNDAISLLQAFRQGEGVGRNPGNGGHPGRSWWPEADSLRALYPGQGDPRHNKSITLEDPARHPAFPRALFGLPIVFHFKGEAIEDELYPDLPGENQSTRMSSPLVLRPLGIGSKSQALAMVLRLKAPPPERLRLKKLTASPPLGPESMERKDLAEYDNSPLKSKGSAVDAFMAFAAKRGFKKAKLS